MLPFGWVRVFWVGEKVIKIELTDQNSGPVNQNLARDIELMIRAPKSTRELKVALPQFISDFARRVLNECARICFGNLMSYGELARAVGKPGAARAVGQVLAHNQIPLFFPCHRVIASDGRLGGFTSGLEMKRRLLEFEGWRVEGIGFDARVVR
ncbi:MAG: methylated-DNA--[protein]-cysteine S-methyltransferase [bacterium]